MSIWNWFLARSRLTPVRIILGSLSLFILSALYVLYALILFIVRVPDEFPELASMAVLFSCIIWILPKLHRRRRISDARHMIWLHGIPAGLLLFGLGNGARSEPVVLLVFLISALALLSLAPRYDSGKALRSAYWRTLPLFPVGTVAVYAAWSLISIGFLTAQAEIYSAGRSYCIEHQAYRVTRVDQYPSDAPVKSWAQLRGRRLRSDFTINSQGSGPPADSTFNFHALLIIQGADQLEFRNWSYWRQHFDLVSKQVTQRMHLSPSCMPAPHFVLRLPFFDDP